MDSTTKEIVIFGAIGLVLWSLLNRTVQQAAVTGGAAAGQAAGAGAVKELMGDVQPFVSGISSLFPTG